MGQRLRIHPVWAWRPGIRRLGACVFLGGLAFALAPGAAGAASVTISGDRLQVTAEDNGVLQATATGSSSTEFYPPGAGLFFGFPVDTGTNGAAGPAIAAGTVYGPPTGPSTANFTPVSQSGVTGNGSQANPYTQVTSYKVVGSDGKDYLLVTQTITYVNGSTQFGLTYQIRNVTGSSTGPGALPLRFRASEGADTYFSGSDSGTGYFLPGPPRFVGGINPDVGRAGGIVETGSPAWSHYQEDVFTKIFNIIGNVAGPGFADTINQNNVDNGVGVEWDDHYGAGQELAAGQSVSYFLTWKFEIGLDTLTLTPSSTTANVGQTVQLVAALTDPNGNPVANTPIRYAVMGANASTGMTSTDATGKATINLTGANAGNDGVLASADLNSNGTYDPGEPLAGATIQWNAAAPPPPVFGQSFDVVPTGTVLVRVPGTSTFVQLTASALLPLGTVVDTTNGAVTLTSARDASGTPQSISVYEGAFQVTQTGSRSASVHRASSARHKRAHPPLTVFTLTGPLPTGCSASGARAHSSAKNPSRHLWGNGKGNYRTVGHLASATVVGTKWLVEDSCAGTRTTVVSGVVRVRDFRRHRTVRVKAGHSYLARARH